MVRNGNILIVRLICFVLGSADSHTRPHNPPVYLIPMQTLHALSARSHYILCIEKEGTFIRIDPSSGQRQPQPLGSVHTYMHRSDVDFNIRF